MRKRVNITFDWDIYKEFQQNCLNAGLPLAGVAVILQQYMEQINTEIEAVGKSKQLELFERSLGKL